MEARQATEHEEQGERPERGEDKGREDDFSPDILTCLERTTEKGDTLTRKSDRRTVISDININIVTLETLS